MGYSILPNKPSTPPPPSSPPPGSPPNKTKENHRVTQPPSLLTARTLTAVSTVLHHGPAPPPPLFLVVARVAVSASAGIKDPANLAEVKRALAVHVSSPDLARVRHSLVLARGVAALVDVHLPHTHDVICRCGSGSVVGVVYDGLGVSKGLRARGVCWWCCSEPAE